MTEPIVIVGSRLQALIYLVSAGALGVGLWTRLNWIVIPIVLVLVILGVDVAAKRVTLTEDSVAVRRAGRTRTASHGDFGAAAGHRYLTIRFNDGARARIEIPVEIRPEVRSWAEANQR